MSGVETKVVHSPARGSLGHLDPAERARVRAEREVRRVKPPTKPRRKGWRTP